MRKQAQSARGRYVSAEKVQELFAQLGIGTVRRDVNVSVQHVADKSISIYVNGGTVNITFNEKGGKAWCSLFTICSPLFPQEPGHGKRLLLCREYKNVLIKDELSLDALKHEIGDTVNRINAEHPNLKRMKCTATPLGRIVPYVSRLMS